MPSPASITIYDGPRAEATIRLAATLTPGDPTLFMGTWRPLDSDPTVGGWFSGTIDDVEHLLARPRRYRGGRPRRRSAYAQPDAAQGLKSPPSDAGLCVADAGLSAGLSAGGLAGASFGFTAAASLGFGDEAGVGVGPFPCPWRPSPAA